MASGDISVVINSETKAFRQGVEAGIIAPLEDAEKALDDLGKSKGPEQLEREMRDAQKATERLADETEDTARAIEREFRDSYRKVGDSAEDGMGRVKVSAQEVQQEIGQNLGEAVSSIRGDLGDLAQVGQDTLGGLAATLAGSGPGGLVGAAGLAAGATGLGLVAAAFDANRDRVQENEQAVADWADAYIEAGDKALSAGVTAAKFQQIITDPEKFKEAEKNAQLWGVSVETAVAAMSGNEGAIRDVTASVQDMNAALDDAASKEGLDLDPAGKLAAQTGLANAASDALAKLTGEMDSGRERAALLNRYYEDLINSTAGATKEVDELGNELYSLPDGTQVMVDAETRQATQNVDKFKGDLDGVQEVVTSTVRFTADTSAWDAAVSRIKATNIRVGGQVVYRTPNGQLLQ